MNKKEIIQLFATGTGAGILSSLFGVGGGILFVPALHLLFGLDIKKAIGTSLSCILPISIVSGLSHYTLFEGEFPWKAAMILSFASILAAQVGVFASGKLKPKFLTYIFIVYFLFTSLRLLLKDAQVELPDKPIPPDYVLGILGSISGFVSSLMGVGGGVVIVSALVSFFEVKIVIAVALSLIVIIPSTLSGLAGHIVQKNVAWKYTAPLIFPAMFSAYFTAKIVHKISSRNLELLFCVFAILVSYSMWKKAGKNPA
ncbi:MAG: sulfite exporter TauE/SafE family protein [Leptospira sp.]|nr:sulfite exporter TauE/SafE family protein [Leptospira sp.]